MADDNAMSFVLFVNASLQKQIAETKPIAMAARLNRDCKLTIMISNDAVEKPLEGSSKLNFGGRLTHPKPDIVEYSAF